MYVSKIIILLKEIFKTNCSLYNKYNLSILILPKYLKFIKLFIQLLPKIFNYKNDNLIFNLIF